MSELMDSPVTIHIWKISDGITYYTYSLVGSGIFEDRISSEALSDAIAAGEFVVGSDRT